MQNHRAMVPVICRSWLVVLLVMTGCGALGADPSKCQPACASGQACCQEPNHAVTDGGLVGSAWVCVTPTNGVCPTLP